MSGFRQLQPALTELPPETLGSRRLASPPVNEERRGRRSPWLESYPVRVISDEKGTPNKTGLLTLRGVFSRDTESWSGDFGGVGGEPAGCDRTPETGSANRESPWRTRSVEKRRKHLGKTKNAERGDSRRFLLTVGSCFSVEKQKAPRKELSS